MPLRRPRRASRTQAIRPERNHVAKNRAFWERTSASYDRRCRAVLGGRHALAWGLWRVPESEARYLGPIRGRRILEVGCGAGRWSLGLRSAGARPVGIDLSLRQLHTARRLSRDRPLPLVRGNAESLPFGDGTFDLTFCDWGALTFADPKRAIPECARVLRRGGRLIFATASPIRFLAFDRRNYRQGRRLTHRYFGLHRLEGGTSVEFQLTYGEWIALFVKSGLAIERLVETRPPVGRASAYLSRRDNAWARSWPMECVWTLRREK